MHSWMKGRNRDWTDEKRWRRVIPFELLAQSCANFKSCVIQQLHTQHKDHLRGKQNKEQKRPYVEESGPCDSIAQRSGYKRDVENKAHVSFNPQMWV